MGGWKSNGHADRHNPHREPDNSCQRRPANRTWMSDFACATGVGFIPRPDTSIPNFASRAAPCTHNPDLAAEVGAVNSRRDAD